MRLTIVITILTMFQLSAATSFGQRITYVQKDVSLVELFKEIKKQTGYNIFWNESKLDLNKTINANFKDASLNEVLENSLKGMPISYSIVLQKKSISIKYEEPSFLDNIVRNFSAIDVRGTVVDDQGNPLSGATVKVKGTTKSTATNEKGEFYLQGVDENAVLVITYLGFESKEVKASGNLGSITLTVLSDDLKEVEINAGYYMVKDRERTGSISRVTQEDIGNQPVSNILGALQANVPGLQIVQNTGNPGGGFSVRIRGQNSILQGNDPFYVIDGVPFNTISVAGTRSNFITPNASPLASISPSDIESIEILKDADATAIYGSRGSNGVILITTRKGKDGHSKIGLSVNQGISRVGKKMKLMNVDEYLSMREEALMNDGISESATDYDINGTWDKTRNIDWQKELIGENAATTNILGSLSGGTSNVTYLVGGSFYREGTVFPGDHSYKRGGGNFSLQYKSNNKRFAMNFDANYSQIKSNLFTQDLTLFIGLPPNYPALTDSNGNLNWDNNTMYANPIANSLKPYEAKTGNLISNMLISYKLLPTLNIKSNFGYSKIDRKEFSSDPLMTYNPNDRPYEMRRSFFTNNSVDNWIVENQVDWSKIFGEAKLNILVGNTFQQGLTDFQEVRGSGYTSDALMRDIGGASTFSIPLTSYLQYRYTAIFGRANLNLSNRYIFNLTGRRDGSSRFGTNNRFANFGAIGAAWLLSNEQILKNIFPSSAFVKLRMSYGITGNDSIRDYGYLELWNFQSGTYQGLPSLTPSFRSNLNYAWEVNKKAEVAIDFGLLDGRINGSVGYYSNRSSNQLVNRSLAPSTGSTAITDNIPARIANTGLEFEINTKNLLRKSFTWTTSFNFTRPTNKLVSYPGLDISGFANLYAVGQPLSIKKLFSTNIDPQSGLYVRKDYTNDGVINANDQYILKFIGRKYYGGLTNSLTFGNCGLDFLFQFVKQAGNGYLTDWSGNAGQFVPQIPSRANFPVAIFDRWTSIGQQSTYQKFSTSTQANTSHFNTTFTGGLAVEDASFIRLKNLAFYYNLNKKNVQKLNMENAKLIFQMQNLFTITHYKGLDPETLTSNRLPSLQVFSFGLQLTL